MFFIPTSNSWKTTSTEKKSAWNVLLFGTTPSDQPTLCRANPCTGLRLVITEDKDMADIIVLILTLLF
jgi:hypothetical protein